MKKLISLALATATLISSMVALNTTASAATNEILGGANWQTTGSTSGDDFRSDSDKTEHNTAFNGVSRHIQMMETELAKRITNNIDSSWTDAQKVAYAMSRINNQIRYGGGGSIYQGLFSGYGTCMSYSGSFKCVMDLLGIPAHRVSGTMGKGQLAYHAWNVVKINGVWYDIDANKAAFLRPDHANGYYEDTCCDTKVYENGTPNFKVTKTSDYWHSSDSCYFESNGKWYQYDDRYIGAMDSSLKSDSYKKLFRLEINKPEGTYTAKEAFAAAVNGTDWEPSVFAVANEKFYYDWKDSIYEYNPQTNSSKKIYTIPYTIKSGTGRHNKVTYSGNNQDFAEINTCRNSPIAWLGADKYALYYVLRDGKTGSIAFGSDKTKLELTSTSKTIKVGEVTYATCMASTEYVCGVSVKYSSSNPAVADVDEAGLVYGNKAGTATITVEAYGRKNSYKVTVKNSSYTGKTDGVKATKVSNNNNNNNNNNDNDTVKAPVSTIVAYDTSIGLDVNKKLKLSYCFNNTNAKFVIDNTKVAKIVKDSKGNKYIKAVGEGTTKLRATYNGDTVEVIVGVLDTKKPTSSLSVTTKTIKKNGVKLLHLEAKLSKGSDDYVIFYNTSGSKLTSYSRSTMDGTADYIIRGSGKVKLYAVTTSGKVKTINVTI